MKKLIVVTVMLMIAVQAWGEDALNLPWKRIVKAPGYELWYDSSTVKETPQYIDVDEWELDGNNGTSKNRHTRFERSTGRSAIGEVKGYKGDRLMGHYDFAKNGYMFKKAVPEERKLFRVLNK